MWRSGCTKGTVPQVPARRRLRAVGSRDLAGRTASSFLDQGVGLRPPALGYVLPARWAETPQGRSLLEQLFVVILRISLRHDREPDRR